MIEYKCRFCGTDMASPESRSGEMEQCPECGKAQAVPVAADGDAAGLSAANSTEDLSDVTQTCPRCHKSLSIAYTPGRELSCSYCVAKLRIAPDKSVVSIPDDSSEAPPDGTETCPDSNEASQSDMEPPPPNPATVIYVKAIILSVILVPVIATAIYLAAGGGRSGRRRFDEWGIRFSAPPGWNKWTGSKEYQAVEMLQSQLGGTGRHVTHAALWETPDKRAVFVVGMYRAASDEYLQSLQSSERNHMEAEQRRGNVTKIHELAIVNVGGRDAVKSDTERSSGVRSECYYLPDTPNVVCIMMLARRSSEFGTYHEQIKGSLAGLSIGSRRSDRDVRDPDDAGEAGEFPTLTLALILASLTALPVLARMGRVRSCEPKVRGLIARDQADYRVRRLLEKAFGRFPDTAVGRRVANCALFFFFPLAIVLGYLCSLASLHFGWCCLAGVVLGGVSAGFLSDWISQISDERMTLRKLRARLREEFPELWHKLAAYWRQRSMKERQEQLEFEKKAEEFWDGFSGESLRRSQEQTQNPGAQGLIDMWRQINPNGAVFINGEKVPSGLPSIPELDAAARKIASMATNTDASKASGLYPHETEIAAIGRAINASHGFKGMQHVWTVLRKLKGPGPTSELTRIWNGIGKWQS